MTTYKLKLQNYQNILKIRLIPDFNSFQYYPCLFGGELSGLDLSNLHVHFSRFFSFLAHHHCKFI